MLNDGSRVKRPPAAPSVLFQPLSRRYALQIGQTTLFTAAALVLARGLDLPILAVIAASGFLVFCLPSSPMASPRNVLGGFAAAVAIAGGLDLISGGIASATLRDLSAAAAVGLSLLVMALTKTEHVPATGAVLALSLQWDAEAAVSLMLMALILAIAHTLLRRPPAATL